MAETAEDPTSDVHEIANLRRPLHKLDVFELQKIERLKKLQPKGITASFLNSMVVPRHIVFIDEQKNMIKLAQLVDRKLIDPAEIREHVRNIVINVNFYKAKYDFEIGKKIKPNSEILNAANVKLFNKNCILEILQLCSF